MIGLLFLQYREDGSREDGSGVIIIVALCCISIIYERGGACLRFWTAILTSRTSPE